MRALAQPPCPRQQNGESLVGLMAGLGIGLVVLAAGMQMLAQHLRAHKMALQDSHMHHDLRAILNTVTHDLQSAQFIADAWHQRAGRLCTDAFCDGPQDFSIQGNRINFSQDRNHNGQQDNNECRGFRLTNGEVKARTACQPEVWTSLTDAGSLNVVSLSWEVHCEPHGRLWARQVTVSLVAQWPGDATRQWPLHQTVTLRNDVPDTQRPTYCS